MTTSFVCTETETWPPPLTLSHSFINAEKGSTWAVSRYTVTEQRLIVFARRESTGSPSEGV